MIAFSLQKLIETCVRSPHLGQEFLCLTCQFMVNAVSHLLINECFASNTHTCTTMLRLGEKIFLLLLKYINSSCVSCQHYNKRSKVKRKFINISLLYNDPFDVLMN